MSCSEVENQTAPGKPDFENHLADFETAFFRFAAETDPSFDISLLRNNPLAPISVINFNPPAELMHPTTKYELRLPIRLATPQTINSDIFGNKVVLESNIKVKGSVFGVEEVFIGPNCVIDGSVISSGKVRVEEGSTIGNTISGQLVELSGPVTVGGPIISRSELNVTGSLDAQALLAEGNIFLMGGAEDQVKLAASFILTRNGDIETTVPLFLGTGKKADPNTQKFYFSHNNNSFRLVRAHHDGPEPLRVEQNTILTSLTDTELEKLLAELAVLEHGN